MITLDQIKKLEAKVHAAVERIHTLSSENETLKERLEKYEGRIGELEQLVSAFKSDQDEIEAGIVSALQHLDELEDNVSKDTIPSESVPEAVEDGEGVTDDVVEDSGDAVSEDTGSAKDVDAQPDIEDSGEGDESGSELDIF